MTSVPKPLKFLAPIYNDVKKAHEGQTDKDLKVSYRTESIFFVHDRINQIFLF